MGRFKTWLLKRLVRRLLSNRNSRQLIQIIWEQAAEVWYEDNANTRYDILEEHLDISYRRELKITKEKLIELGIIHHIGIPS